MDASRFHRLSELFDAARELAPAARGQMLTERCGDDTALRAEVEALLAQYDAAARSDEDPMLAAASALRDEAGHAAVEEGPLPERIGRFRIRDEIARGGFGIVLRGEDETIGRDVAVKILSPARSADRRAEALLQAEGRISGRLQHPGIVPVYELGRADDDRPFVAMKVVEGRTLSSLLRERAEPAADRPRFLAIFGQICQAIGYAHARGVLHRDLKPHNLMVGAFGEVQVMDWGLAVALDDVDDDRDRLALGTPAYIAPEQARGDAAALDPRSDVFGLGAILCEILTGAPPFVGADAATTLEAARAADLGEALARIDASGADPQVVALARRCLAAEPADRPADGGTVAAAIRDHLESLAARAREAELEAATAVARAASERKARRLTTALGSLVMLVIFAGAAVALWSQHAADQRQRKADARLQAAVVDAERAAASAAASLPETVERWEFARAAAQSAARLAPSSTGSEVARTANGLLERVERRLDEVRFAARLRTIADDARLRNSSDRGPEAEAWRAAFEAHVGRPIDTARVADFAAVLTKHPFREALITALDRWALAEHQLDARSPIERWILQLAHDLDDHEWRREARDAIASRDGRRMLGLAVDPRRSSAPADAAVQLAVRLMTREGGSAPALELMEDAVRRHSADFEVNFHLAMIHNGIGSDWQALRYASTACALRPDDSLSHVLLAGTLYRLGRNDEAADAARHALQIAGSQHGAMAEAAAVLLRTGDVEAAETAVADYAERVPPNHAHYALLAETLGNVRLRQGRHAEAVRAFRDAVASPMSGPDTPRWGFENEPQARRFGVALEAELGERDDPDTTFLAARFREATGSLREALALYERVARTAPDRRWVRDRIADLTSNLGGTLASIAAVDRAWRELPSGADAASIRSALGLAPPVPAERDRGAADYAEGLLRIALDDPAGAVERFERTLVDHRDEPLAWLRLHEAWTALDGRTTADARIARLLEAGAPPAALPIAPRPPQRVAPADDATVTADVELAVGGFAPVDPRHRWVGTLWEVRESGDAWERSPRFQIRIDGSRLRIPPGVLAANRTYQWRAHFLVDPRQLVSAPCAAGTFRTRGDLPTPLPVDLHGAYDRDVIGSADETADGAAFDPPNRWQLVVEGHGGDPTLRGVPADGRIGMHRLAAPDGLNSVSLRPSPPSLVRIALPRGHYTALLLLGASGNGNAQLLVTVRYADDTVRRFVWACPDWFLDGSGQLLDDRYSTSPVRMGMDRVDLDGNFDRRGGARLFEANLPCDPTKEVVELLLTNRGARFDDPDTTAHLLAVTGLRLDAAEGR